MFVYTYGSVASIGASGVREDFTGGVWLYGVATLLPQMWRTGLTRDLLQIHTSLMLPYSFRIYFRRNVSFAASALRSGALETHLDLARGAATFVFVYLTGDIKFRCRKSRKQSWNCQPKSALTRRREFCGKVVQAGYSDIPRLFYCMTRESIHAGIYDASRLTPEL